ncbi:MAG: Rieske 2Fe-2S domain-containing protein [Abitibacteriaceae bacterium]|nr:Rieske 2Fe-2S domain-containing protein [Abditibacteriaceae bacterium]
MNSEPVLEAINQQEWIEPVADGLGSAVQGAYKAGGSAGQKVKNFMHGTWLGHQLHPVITDVPIGSWTTAFVLDVIEAATGRKEYGKGADVAVGLGILGALASAAAGLTDWSDTDGRARKVGVVHGLLNITATALYIASWFMRKSGKRGSGRTLAWLGYAISGSAAYLGGALVYTEKIGVDHAPREEMPDNFIPVLPDADLPEGKLVRAAAGEVKILLVRRGENIYALSETCSHLGGPLAEGKLEGDSVVCPWHGSRFTLQDGSVLDGPATHPQPCLEARVRGGYIEVRVNKE